MAAQRATAAPSPAPPAERALPPTQMSMVQGKEGEERESDSPMKQLSPKIGDLVEADVRGSVKNSTGKDFSKKVEQIESRVQALHQKEILNRTSGNGSKSFLHRVVEQEQEILETKTK